MTTVATADRTPLGLVPERGRWTGFGPLLRKELGAWWLTRRWWLQALLWLGLMNGFHIPVYFTVLAHPEANLEMMQQLTEVFFSLGGVAATIGAVVLGQDAIIGERQTGTAAWILSKPVARPAFILAKFIAQGISLPVLSVILQAPLAFGFITVLAGRMPSPVPFLAAVGLVVLNLLFYTAMTLLLGTLFRGRPAVLLVALGWLFASPLAVDIAPAVARVVPFGLPDLGVALAIGMPLRDLPLGPVALGVVWTLFCLALACWRFEREEL